MECDTVTDNELNRQVIVCGYVAELIDRNRCNICPVGAYAALWPHAHSDNLCGGGTVGAPHSLRVGATDSSMAPTPAVAKAMHYLGSDLTHVGLSLSCSGRESVSTSFRWRTLISVAKRLPPETTRFSYPTRAEWDRIAVNDLEPEKIDCSGICRSAVLNKLRHGGSRNRSPLCLENLQTNQSVFERISPNIYG